MMAVLSKTSDVKTPDEIIAETTGLMPIARKHIVAALDAAGYVIVPKEPTDDMCKAVDSLADEWPVIRADYRRMIAMAQTQEAGQPEG